MTSAARLALCLTLLGASAPAVALGQAKGQAQAADRGRDAVVTMHAYGGCIAQRSRYRAERVLALPPGSREEEALLRQVSTPNCLVDQRREQMAPGSAVALSFNAQLMRGAMAESYFESDFGAFGSPPRRRPAALFDMTAIDGVLNARGPVVLNALIFGECVVRAAPEEDAAFAAMGPTLSECMNRGRRLQLSRPQLRGVLAEAAYRHAAGIENMTPRGGAQ